MEPVAERLTAQLLSGPPATDAVAVAERLLAVQAQDPRGARLAVRVRTAGRTAADVDRALTEDRTLVITWLNRGTLHLVRTEDLPWLHALTTPGLFTGNARRLSQEGVSPRDADKAVKTISRALADGPLTRPELRERIAAAGVRTEGQALVHLLMLSCLRGIAIRGPMVGGQHAYALVADWLEQAPPVDRERALGELARRYLVGHGPATERDLARWAGIPLRDVRVGLGRIASLLEPLDDGLIGLTGRPRAAALPAPRLLGAFDPLLLGWTSREPILGDHRSVVTTNGLFRPFALVGGRAVATWRLEAGVVRLEPFGRLPKQTVAALEEEGREVVRYLGERRR